MSSIAFHSPDRTVRVSGRERGSMGMLCFGFLKLQIGDVDTIHPDWVEAAFVPGHYLHDDAVRWRLASEDKKWETRRRLVHDLLTWLHVGNEPVLQVDGEAVDTFELKLNSAIAWGNRSVQLAAKLHGQCEIHAFCEGEDRAWLADQIDAAVDDDTFRPEPMGYDGWPAVSAFLRETADQPVVTSYSVTDSFPNSSLVPDAAGAKGEEDDEWWEKVDRAQQWAWAMSCVREDAAGLRIAPNTVGKVFGTGLTGAKLIRKFQ